ncbi:DUF7373 family lipoprotein [Nocardia blacklockiae]|uniref:DUF7373 family lipoprotein n=1 Tax=Nocardia blacklockiae TaxID=480036 RepID=UPI001893A081|nr:hypothetical protein [Nocardia blacklockiae]MBF6170497.1 hypothetical protein [Nocardia blacklockiae]
MRRLRIRYLPVVSAVGAALLLATGCTVAGTPARLGPDRATIDIGPYGTDLLVAPRDVDERSGRVLESVRMGEAVVDPVEIDPALTHGLGSVASVPIPTPAQAGFLAEPVRAVLERHGMLAGFSVGGMDAGIAVDLAVGRARLLTVLLLRFPDPGAARAAAGEIDAVDAAVSPENVPVPIPEHPEAHGHWRPSVPTLAATAAYGDFVVSVLAGERTTDLEALRRLASTTFTAQRTRLDDFRPTPPDRFATLPLDPDGMLARLLPEAPGVWPWPKVITKRYGPEAGWSSTFITTGLVYGPRATHRYGSWQRPAEGIGMVLAVNGLHTLLRLPDAVTARREYDDAADELTEPGTRQLPGPAGIPDARCMESLSSPPISARFACRLVYGRYEAIVYSRTADDARHRISAQYLLLARSE